MNEIWLPIADWPYEVSSCGRVRRATRAKGSSLKPLKPHRNKGGYLRVRLSRACTVKQFLVSNLVCVAFHGPRPSPDHDADHEDFDLENNAADNLRWRHKTLNRGEARSPLGEAHAFAKLTDADVLEIRSTDFVHGTLTTLARRYGVCLKTIAEVRDAKTWRHI